MTTRTIREVIAKQKPLTASSHTTVSAAARLMKKHHVGAVMVVEGAHLTGIFTERDAVYRVLAQSRNPTTTRIGDVMTANPRTVEADKQVDHALLIMYDGGFRHVPVIEKGKPVGMISARDALGPELRQLEEELEQRDHIGEVMR